MEPQLPGIPGDAEEEEKGTQPAQTSRPLFSWMNPGFGSVITCQFVFCVFIVFLCFLIGLLLLYSLSLLLTSIFVQTKSG